MNIFDVWINIFVFKRLKVYNSENCVVQWYHFKMAIHLYVSVPYQYNTINTYI